MAVVQEQPQGPSAKTRRILSQLREQHKGAAVKRLDLARKLRWQEATKPGAGVGTQVDYGDHTPGEK